MFQYEPPIRNLYNFEKKNRILGEVFISKKKGLIDDVTEYIVKLIVFGWNNSHLKKK